MKRARDLAQARRLAAEISTAAGLPRCAHPRHALGDAAAARLVDPPDDPARSRGRVPWCTCASARDVDPECPHVTWAAVAVIELDGEVLIQGDPAQIDAHPEVEAMPRVRVERERLEHAEPRYDPREEARARRAATPEERRPR